MVYNRFLCDTNVPISHQVAGGGATPGPSSPIVGIQLANEHGVQERLSDHQTNNYPPDRLLPGAVGDSGTHPLRFGESRDGPTTLCPPQLAAPLHSVVGAYGQEDPSGGRQEQHDTTTRTPHDVASHYEGTYPITIPLGRTGGSARNHVVGHRGRDHEQPISGNPEPNYMLYSTGNESTDARGAPARFYKYPPPLGGGPHEDPGYWAMGWHSIPATHDNNPRPDSHLTTDRAASTSRGPSVERGITRHNPRAGAVLYHGPPRSNITLPPAGPSRDAAGAIGYIEPSDTHSLNSGRARDVEHSVESPPDVRSNRPPIYPDRDQRSGTDNGTKQAVHPGKAAAVRKRASGRKPRGSGPIVQVPVVTAVPYGSSHYTVIQQTLYECRARQDGWIRQPPIEFGWIKLTHAANPKYLDTPGHDDKVLKYEGVGSSITCRLNFSGHKAGKSKILTTNHKTVRESITKKKLAREVGKLVESHIETIRAVTGCRDVRPEDVVLTRLFHVSKASWQPELWYKVPAAGRGLP